MKKIFLLLGAVLLALTASGQHRKVSIIPTIGYQVSTPLDQKEDYGYYRPMHRFRAGVDADLILMDRVGVYFSLKPGLYYSAEGLTASNEGMLYSIDPDTPGPGLELYPVELNYLEVPVLAQLGFRVDPALSVYINVGPYLAYGVSGKISNLNFYRIKGEGSEHVTELDPFKAGYNRFDWGFQGGFGVEYMRVQLGFGVQVGLQNMGESADYLRSEKTTTQTMFVTLGYRF